MFNALKLVNSLDPAAIVIAVFTDKKLDARARALDSGGVIAAALDRADATGDSGKIIEAHLPGKKKGERGVRVLVVGLGKKESFSASSLRAVAGAIGRKLAATKDEKVSIDIEGALASVPKIDLEHCGRCLGEGLGLIAWNFNKFKGKGSGDNKKTSLSVSVVGADLRKGAEFGLALAQSANFCRDLSETPPNVATTSYIAEQARQLARKTGLKFSVIEGAQLEREKLVGLINVGKASENKPCLVRLEYRPKNAAARNKKPVVLVGKTMTYDTGGLSLKINNGMVGMKRDKDGGCAVLGAMHAIATVIEPSRPVVALLAVAENSISDEAYRPDDVITYRNGVTVEVTNTDAEGRLVLADALIWACENEKPQYIVDLATLTGGVVVALGSTFAGLFCEDDALRAKLQRAMDTSGERWWRLPMHDEYRDLMKSPIADILNSNPNRKAHPIQGAAFLSYFVEKNIPWAHIDIAGVHVSDSDSGCFTRGSTGWGVRLLADLLSE